MSVLLVQALVSTLVIIYACDRLVLGLGVVAQRRGIPNFLIGLSVAAIITSIPEFYFAQQSALLGEAGPGLGLIIGSSIANIGFVLGLSTLVAGLGKLSGPVIQAPIIIVATSTLVYALFLDSFLSRVDGMVLFIVFFSVIRWMYRLIRPYEPIRTAYVADFGANVSGPRSVIIVAVAILTCAAASHFLAKTMLEIARDNDTFFDVNPQAFHLIITSFLMSLPELYICLLSTIRREFEFAFGVIVGSNAFTSTAVLGSIIFAAPHALSPSFISLPIFAMVVLSLALIGLAVSAGNEKSLGRRRYGFLLLLMYIAYLGYSANYYV